MNSEEYTKRFNKYEADYTRRLMAKYFSDKDIYGGKHLVAVYKVLNHGLHLMGYLMWQQRQNVYEENVK